MQDIDKIKKWIDTWEKAGNSLRNVKKEELQSEFYYDNNKSLLHEMLRYAFHHRSVRLTSGLVELQKYFMIMRSKLDAQKQ